MLASPNLLPFVATMGSNIWAGRSLFCLIKSNLFLLFLYFSFLREKWT
jgi:hypothetical protein